MLYLEKSTAEQTVWIPRNDGVIVIPSGHTSNLERKNYNITENGTTQIVPSLGYDGISGGTITVLVPTGSSKEEQSKSVSYTSNGTRTVSPDSGKVLSGVTVSVNVQPQLQTKSASITENGNYSYSCDSGYYGLERVDLSVSVPTGSSKEEQSKTVTYTSNGTRTISPDSGKVLSGVTVSVSVANYDTINNLLKNKYNVKARNLTDFTSLLTSDNRCFIVNGNLEAFAASGITEYSFPEGITSFTDNVCENDVSVFPTLQSITLPSTCKVIGDAAFLNCGIESLTLPSGITKIGGMAFMSNQIDGELIIPNSLTDIGQMAFWQDRITSVTVTQTTPPTLGWGAFGHPDYPDIFYLEEVWVPEESVDVYKAAPNWSDYADLITAHTQPNNEIWYTSTNGAIVGALQWNWVQTIVSNTYVDGKGVIKFNADVTRIPNTGFISNNILTMSLPSTANIAPYAFKDKSNMTTLVIGTGTTSIGSLAFQNCSSLSSLTVKATTPPTLEDNLSDCSDDLVIYVPSESVDTYKRASIWSRHRDKIQAIP